MVVGLAGRVVKFPLVVALDLIKLRSGFVPGFIGRCLLCSACKWLTREAPESLALTCSIRAIRICLRSSLLLISSRSEAERPSLSDKARFSTFRTRRDTPNRPWSTFLHFFLSLEGSTSGNVAEPSPAAVACIVRGSWSRSSGMAMVTKRISG